MTDFSIGKVSANSDLSVNNEAKTPFAKAKAEYNAKKAKIANSDFANSPVALNDLLKEIEKLKELATNENITDEAEWIEAEISDINSKLSSQSSAVNSMPYYQPIIEKKEVILEELQDESELFDALLNKYRSSEEINTGTKKFLENIQAAGISAYHAEKILKRCENEDGDIQQGLQNLATKLLQNNFGANAIDQILHDFVHSDTNTRKSFVPENIINSLISLRNEDIADFEAIKYVRFANSGDFESPTEIEGNIKTLHKAGIKSENVIKIIDNLSVWNAEKTAKKVDATAVKTISTLKNTLTTTRKNEVVERNSELGQLAQEIIDMGADIMFLKNGKIEIISPKEDNTPQKLRERYLNLANETEDSILLDVAKSHKMKNGKLDANYVRVLSVLRNAGVVYTNLQDLIDCTIKEDGTINFETVDSISKLKKSGALSQDLKLLLGNCSEADGKQNAEALQDMCDLSSYVIPGKNVVELLPFIKNNEEAKAFIEYISQFFENKDNVVALSTTAKRSDGVADQNKMDSISVLLRDNCNDLSEKFIESKFVEDVDALITNAQDNETKEMNDDAAGVISILSNNGASFEDMQKGIEMCKNKDGIVDEKLAQILWDMTLQKASLDEISSLIAVCTDEEKNVDAQKADMIISLLQNKFSKDDIAKLLIK